MPLQIYSGAIYIYIYSFVYNQGQSLKHHAAQKNSWQCITEWNLKTINHLTSPANYLLKFWMVFFTSFKCLEAASSSLISRYGLYCGMIIPLMHLLLMLKQLLWFISGFGRIRMASILRFISHSTHQNTEVLGIFFLILSNLCYWVVFRWPSKRTLYIFNWPFESS